MIHAVTANTKDVSMHRHGCCVVQRCLDATDATANIPEDQKEQSAKDRAKLVCEIAANAFVLMQNAYGNYVIQYLVEHGTDNDRDLVMRFVVGNTAELAQQKYSSNVVEKCLAKASPEICDQMMAEIADPEVIQDLLYHRFANYVVQRALKQATAVQRTMLIDAIRPFVGGLGANAGGRRILEVMSAGLWGVLVHLVRMFMSFA